MTSKCLRGHVRLSLYKLLWYPVVNSLGWIAAAYVDSMLSLSPNTRIKGAADLTFLCYGFPSVVCVINSIAFMYTNKELVCKWILELSRYLGLTLFENWKVNATDAEFDHTVVPRINDWLTQITSAIKVDRHTDESNETWESSGEGEGTTTTKNPMCQ